MEMDEEMVMLRNGRLRVLRDGELMDMQEDMTMTDGTRVTMDGTIPRNLPPRALSSGFRISNHGYKI